ncbi:deleted in malignant brain tumors 1 protein-like [Lingula anatina]|uniref:Deleted in malignant brain tumors 1 protein-like n=1 Tax=Lingula anatina TaxID=7574 RepID=A0A1S3IC23_LINAN|nr:deleted in malignant brain tumors 1 protein-like [Lingula anatina]|eukprot:XP_013395792.1 deleted in malignant brain tumors 1 protein-like [Lingula anatina]
MPVIQAEKTTEIPNLTTEEYVGVRLVGGNSYREGRVMVYYDGRWGTICDHKFDDNDARVVCRMLGFGDRYAKAYGGACFGEGSGKIWLNHLHCQGTESSIAQCYKRYGWGNTHCSHSEDVGVSCGFSYRRSCTNYNYTSINHSPILSLLYHCPPPGGPPTAQVETTTTYDPCSSRPCYYGGTCVPQRSYYWPYNYVDYNCTCPWARYGKRCEYYVDIPVRLVGGYSNREGRVEVYYNGRWGTVCDDNFDSNDARVICRMLGFGDRYARSYGGACYGAGSGPIWLDLKCSGSEYSIANCNYTGWGINYCGHQEDAAVSCGYSYSRSCPGSSQYGRQTTENPTTETTSAYDPCSRNPCQYGGTCVRTSSYYWPYTGYRCNCPYYRTGQKCEYSAYGYPETTATNEITTATQETTTYDPCSRNPCQYGGTCIRTNSYYWPYTGYRCNCPYYRTGQKCEYGAYGYQTTEIPNLTTVEYVRVRLVGGNSYREGRVMVYYDGRWGTICDHDFDDNDARVVCRMLGHGDRYAKAYGGACFGEGSGKIWLNHLHCQGTESSLAQCYKGYGWGNTHCSHSEDVGVSCGFSYRRSCTNYNYTTSWPTTESTTKATAPPLTDPCSNNPCYNGGTCVPQRSYYWPYNFVDYNCTCPWDRYGKRCEYYGWPTTESPTTESVTPTVPVRLVGGYSNREGRVEVYYNGRWGTVCDDNFDDNDARVICRMLGFGDRYAKAYQSACYGLGNGQIWLDDVRCSGGEHSISACGHYGWGRHDCSHSEDAGVSCGYSYTRSCPGSSQYGTTEASETTSSSYDPCSSYPCYYGGTCVPKRCYY